jgi:hypothetical protein
MAKTDSYIQLPTDAANTGQLAHVRVTNIGGTDYVEQVWQLADADSNTTARVLATDPAATDAGLVVRPIFPGGVQPVEVSGADVDMVEVRDTLKCIATALNRLIALQMLVLDQLASGTAATPPTLSDLDALLQDA